MKSSALLRGAQAAPSRRCRRARYNSGIGPSSALRCHHLDHRSLRAELFSTLLGEPLVPGAVVENAVLAVADHAVLAVPGGEGEPGPFGDVAAGGVRPRGADLQPVPAESSGRYRGERVGHREIDGLAHDPAASRVRVRPVADLPTGGAE